MPTPWSPGRDGSSGTITPNTNAIGPKTLYRALEQIIPDLRGPGQQDSRIVLELVGTPLTHQRFFAALSGNLRPSDQKPGKGCFPIAAPPFKDSIGWAIQPCRALAYQPLRRRAFYARTVSCH